MQNLPIQILGLACLASATALACQADLGHGDHPPPRMAMEAGHNAMDGHNATDAGSTPTDALDGSPLSEDAAILSDGGPDPRDAQPDAAVIGCTEVYHIGDSLSAYVVDDLVEAYASHEMTASVDAYGGRAIRQKLRDDPRTGLDAVALAHSDGFAGCFVVALGTNDAANISAGARYTEASVIDEMMEAIDPDAERPVLWVNAFTERTTGHYANANMMAWNEALSAAETRWPNLRVFDWAAIAETGIAPYGDGIHHTAAGYAVRNPQIAEAASTLSY